MVLLCTRAHQGPRLPHQAQARCTPRGVLQTPWARSIKPDRIPQHLDRLPPPANVVYNLRHKLWPKRAIIDCVFIGIPTKFDAGAEGAEPNGANTDKAGVEGPVALPEPLVAVDADIVTLHYDCRDDTGEMIDSTRERGEPLTLELGVGEIVGNPLVQALETAVRGHGVGDVVELQLEGGDYKPDLVFKVPTDHPEIERLQGRYRSQGGLEVDKVVELQNGQWAKVVEMTEQEVTIDANNMLAGLQRSITVEILEIDRPPPGEQ